MIIGINASFLRKLDTGIGQVTFNFVRNLMELNVEDVSFVLYVEEDSGLELPKNFEERVFLPRFYKRDDLMRKIIWEKKLLPKEVKRDGCDVFLSLYQSATVFKKNNKRTDSRFRGNDSNKFSMNHTMLVHDAVWKIFPEYLNNWRKKRYYKMVDEGIMNADKILTVSENSKRDIVEYLGVPKDKIDVYYVDCDEVFKVGNSESQGSRQEPLNPQSGDEPLNSQLGDDIRERGDKENDNRRKDSNYIFYVGGFDVRKNVDRLLEAYGMLWRKWDESGDDLKCEDVCNDKNATNGSVCKIAPVEKNTTNELVCKTAPAEKKYLKLKNPLSPLLKKADTKEDGKSNFPDLVLAGKFHSNLVPLVTDLPIKIKKISKKYGLPKERIKQIGFVEQKDLPGWYKNAELFCYPTLYEGFGLPVLEAQNCGCPVVTSNASSISEIASIDNAILVNPENIEEIAGAMYNCLTSDNLRNKLISEGRKNVARFSWDKFAKEVLMDALKEGSRVDEGVSS